MSSVTLTKIDKFYGTNRVLEDINLEILDGEFLVLVGPSGCGKSTTLRMVAGLETPTSGDIFIGDTKVNNVDPADRDIAMVFQNYALYPHMDVYENMAFGLKIRKEKADVIRKRVEESAEILQIQSLLKRKPKELSGGQRQRVALGRALVRKPKVFLFDEPLSNLDAKLRSEMRIEIKRLHALLKTTMMYVTHDQTEAMTMGDRIAIMNGGVIEQLDNPKKCYFKPANKFVAGFIGTPQMNFIEGKLIHNSHGEPEFSTEGLSVSLKDCDAKSNLPDVDSPVTLGVRPEDIFDTSTAADLKYADSYKVKVEITEPLGSNLLTHLQKGRMRFTASFHGSSSLSAGDMVDVAFDTKKIHLFDEKTGINLLT